MLLCYATALLSGENSLVLPFLHVFYHAAFRKDRANASFFGLGGMAGLYVLVRLGLLRHFLTLPKNDNP